MSALSTADRLAVHELLARSGWAYDEARLDVMQACFTDDAQMSVRIAGGDVIGPHVGREAVLALIRNSLDSQSDQRRHVISNVFFESESADSALVISTLTLLATAQGQTVLLSAGTYRDAVVRTSEGWRFRERFLSLDKGY